LFVLGWHLLEKALLALVKLGACFIIDRVVFSPSLDAAAATDL
jgi:hypothetical protein